MNLPILTQIILGLLPPSLQGVAKALVPGVTTLIYTVGAAIATGVLDPATLIPAAAGLAVTVLTYYVPNIPPPSQPDPAAAVSSTVVRQTVHGPGGRTITDADEPGRTA